MTEFTLPELDYDYGALEPHISGYINELHHRKHHAAYVQGANDVLLKLAHARAHGSFDIFRAQFSAAANGLQGSGWAVLGYDGLGGKLLTFQLYDQQANVPLGVTPLLMVDMWEHAYYLQYKNVKADYVSAIWNVVNWADVQERFSAATNNINLINMGRVPSR